MGSSGIVSRSLNKICHLESPIMSPEVTSGRYSLTGSPLARIVIGQLRFSINGHDWSNHGYKHDKKDPYC